MRSLLRGMLVACVAALAMGAAASSALAAPVWESGSPEWQQGGVALTKSVATTWKGKVKLTDSKGGVFHESVGAECEATAEGTVASGSTGEVSKWTFSKCVSTTKGVCPNPGIEAIGLPWHTTLTGAPGSARDAIAESGHGTPGFGLICATGGEVDKCPGLLSASVSNGTGGVNAILSAGGEKLNCARGGEGSGTVEGAELIEAASGGKLEVNGKFKPVTSTIEVKATGEPSITDTKYPLPVGPLRATCKVETAGTIEAGGLGKITKYTVSTCADGSEECSIAEVEPIDLPWKTELYDVGGTVRERIVSGGSGTPQWRFKCSGGSVEDSCGLNTSMLMTNHEEGSVFAAFNEESNKTSCKVGGTEAGKWEGQLKIQPPAGVGAIEVHS